MKLLHRHPAPPQPPSYTLHDSTRGARAVSAVSETGTEIAQIIDTGAGWGIKPADALLRFAHIDDDWLIAHIADATEAREFLILIAELYTAAQQHGTPTKTEGCPA